MAYELQWCRSVVWLRGLSPLCLTLKHCDVAVWVGGWDKKGGGLSWCVCVWCVEGHVSHPRIDNLSLVVKCVSLSWRKTNCVPPGEQEEEQKREKKSKPGEVMFLRVVLWPGEWTKICKPYSAVPYCHLSLSLQTEKRSHFGLGKQKKVCWGFFFSRKEHFSELD